MSDDGSQLLCLLDALAHGAGDLPIELFSERLIGWWHHGLHQSGGTVFDCGLATDAALRRRLNGTPPHKSGGTDVRSNGNGSLMRALPCALIPALWGRDRGEVISAAMTQSLVTHGHPVAQVCCAVYAQLCLLVIEQPEHDFTILLELAMDQVAAHGDISNSPAHRGALVEIWDFRLTELPTGSGYVVNSLWSAVRAVEVSDSWLGAVTQAIQLGNDTDTTACIAGGLAGLRFGLSTDDEGWWRRVRVPKKSATVLNSIWPGAV